MLNSEWDELHLSEEPAHELLELLGYSFVAAESLHPDRDGRAAEPILLVRSVAAVHKLNPWISEENARKAVRQIAATNAPGLIEANEQVHRVLTYGTAVEQDLGDGKRNHSVRFFDFETIDNNDFIFSRQFRVRGAKRDVIADVIVFVNGFPLAMIECKSPTIRDPDDKAIEQILRYQEWGDDFRQLGAPRLFHAMQLVVAAWGEGALFGTVGTPRRHWSEWKVPHPLTVDAIDALLGRKARGQEVLMAGLFARPNLLDLVRNFIVFEVESGRTAKKVGRYQQFIAVNRALARIQENSGSERGGIIWHTQGSGKSLTMLFLALKLRRLPSAENPTILIVTDRRDLDVQISETFIRCGFQNPIRAEAINTQRTETGDVSRWGLRDLLAGATGRTVMTTVQKFQEASDGPHPMLSEASNMFVHGQTRRTAPSTAASPPTCASALPQRLLLRVHGHADRQEAIAARMSDVWQLHRHVHASTRPWPTAPQCRSSTRCGSRRTASRASRWTASSIECSETGPAKNARRSSPKYATLEAIAGAPQRVNRICEDIIDHYERFIRPGGFKAQIVACSREVAALYKETLDRLGAPDSAVIISPMNNDREAIAKWHRTSAEQKKLIDDFKKPEHPLSFLIVCDMLLTGFDAPVEQVMYLDASLREHTLLQAIARVNRTAEGKDYGLIVDYWGRRGPPRRGAGGVREGRRGRRDATEARRAAAAPDSAPVRDALLPARRPHRRSSVPAGD
jgi:type I restriction enzyme R subunit